MNLASDIGGFREGGMVLLTDKKGGRHLLELKSGGTFHTNMGTFLHNDLIGLMPGQEIKSSTGSAFRIFQPSLEEYIIEMERGAQIIYPKDLAAILMMADIFPGVRVFESGVGSGALSAALLRAGACVTGYEIREDHMEKAIKNVKGIMGEESLQRYELFQRDCYQEIEGPAFDRILLDLSEPWKVVPHAEKSLLPGGIFLAYTPSITQAVRLSRTLSDFSFMTAETLEVLHRSWYIKDRAVRPDHKMVAHTGFLTSARKVQAE